MKTKLAAICATAVVLLGVNATPASAALQQPGFGWLDCIIKPWKCGN